MIKNIFFKLLSLTKGDDFMSSIAIVYATLIIDGLKTFAQVPVKLLPQVQQYLASMGLGTDGKPLPDETPVV
jgi:hypothetical protein